MLLVQALAFPLLVISSTSSVTFIILKVTSETIKNNNKTLRQLIIPPLLVYKKVSLY